MQRGNLLTSIVRRAMRPRWPRGPRPVSGN
jgi:hypothetical protein